MIFILFKHIDLANLKKIVCFNNFNGMTWEVNYKIS